MIRRCWPYLGLLLAGVILSSALPSASAGDLGKMRVQRMDGSWIVGEVEELADSYRIKVSKGITVTLKKNEIKAMLPAEEDSGDKPTAPEGSAEKEGTSLRREVPDEEINELLAGITIEAEDVATTTQDMVGELPLNEDSVAEMCHIAGVPKDKEHVLEKPHFVLVYTSTKEEANRLASRLEAVWSWNVRFMNMVHLPLKRPQYKLEIYYFGTHKGFDGYVINLGQQPNPGILGFYSPNLNRSAFFDLSTWSPLEPFMEMMKRKEVPFKERQRAKNIIRRWVEFNNMEVIQHESGHHIHFNIGLFPPDPEFMQLEGWQSLPRWLVEGTTMMFEFPPTKAGASLGSVNHHRLKQFRQIFSSKPSPQQLKSFVLDNRIFMGGGGTFYPLGWSLVNYFWTKKRAGYEEYLRIISQREPGVEVSETQREKEFEDCFGRLDEKWIDEWYKFMEGLQLRESVLPPEIHP